MTITCQPMDATAGAPSYSAQNERQNMSVLYGGGGGVALAARSGFRVGTPSNILTATSTTWTLGPCSAVISPAAATAQGSYRWATDTNATGAMTAANATNPRKDIVYIQVNDSSSGDGSGALTAPVLYLAGVAAASPVAPALPVRSFLVGTIDVPVSGGGSPTVTLNPATFVAAGARLPIASAGERGLLTPYRGMEILRTDLTQAGAAGVIERWNGTTWDHFGIAGWTTASNSLAAGAVWNLGAHTAVPSKTTDAAFVTVGGGGITFRDAGNYDVAVTQKFSANVSNGRAFISLDAATGLGASAHARVPFGINEDTTTLAVNITVTAGQTVYPQLFQSVGTVNVTGAVNISRRS